MVTDEEKLKTTSGRKKLTDEQMKVIKADMKNKAYTTEEIKKRHNISDNTYKKIKNTVLEKFAIDRKDYGLDN